MPRFNYDFAAAVTFTDNFDSAKNAWSYDEIVVNAVTESRSSGLLTFTRTGTDNIEIYEVRNSVAILWVNGMPSLCINV